MMTLGRSAALRCSQLSLQRVNLSGAPARTHATTYVAAALRPMAPHLPCLVLW